MSQGFTRNSYAAFTNLKWIDLTVGYKTDPAFNSAIASGDVYTYVYAGGAGDVTYYRLVPNSSANPDAFYSTFSSGVLSGEIARKGVTL